MKKKNYYVTIKATVTKTIQVKATNEESAIEEAYENFSVLNDSNEEDYDQEVLSVATVTPK